MLFFLNSKNIRIILGIIICALSGVLLHFVYEWSGENKFVGYFSAVNESTWEHLKLLFIPMLAFTIFEYFKFKEFNTNFLFSRTVSIIVGMLFIVSAFYTISGITGKTNMPVINISIYVLAVIIAFLITRIIMNNSFNSHKHLDLLSFLILGAIFFLFILWSYNSPSNIGIFYDYVNK